MKNFLKSLAARVKGVSGLLAPVRKAVGTALGGATGVGVAEVLNAVGLHLPVSVSGGIAVVLAFVGTYLAPANVAKTADTPAPAPMATPAETATPAAPVVTPDPAPEVTNG